MDPLHRAGKRRTRHQETLRSRTGNPQKARPHAAAAGTPTQARQAIKECDRRLARYQAALDAGADPAVVTQWINDAQRDKNAAQKKPDALPAARKKESPLTDDQIRAITERFGDIAQRIQTAAAEEGAPLRSPRHHHQLRQRNEGRDRKVEALDSVPL